jgi:hypothetical protein
MADSCAVCGELITAHYELFVHVHAAAMVPAPFNLETA